MEEKKKVVYISGPITNVKEYWKPFEEAEEELEAMGYIALSPARLPEGMTKEQYMRICFAMEDSADAVLMLPNWTQSDGAQLEAKYAEYIGKPVVFWRVADAYRCNTYPKEVTVAWLKKDLKEAIGE